MVYKLEQDRLNYEANRRKEAQSERNDIGELPPVADPQRRAACENDFILFCNTYLKKTYFYRPWSETQIKIAKLFEHIVKVGGKQAVAHKRLGAKTTIAKAVCFWGAFCGKHKHQIYIAASTKMAESAVQFFENELLTNDLLLADFPEVCIPFRQQNGKRNNNPSYHGKDTDCYVKKEEIQFPVIEKVDKDGEFIIGEDGDPTPYPTSGVLIQFYSINSNIRGRNAANSYRIIPPSTVRI